MNIVLEKGKLIVTVQELQKAHKEFPRVMQDVSSVWTAVVVQTSEEIEYADITSGDVVLISGRSLVHTLSWNESQNTEKRVCFIDRKDVLGRLERSKQ